MAKHGLNNLSNIVSRLSFYCTVVCAVFLVKAACAQDISSLIAKDSLVVLGDKASLAETEAATRLAEWLRARGGSAQNLVFADRINADLEIAASHHILVVGTIDSNRIMQRLPSHWALDRDRYYAGHQAYQPWMPATAFYCAGYSTAPTTTPAGYIECDRNPYWHYAVNILMQKGAGQAETSTNLPYRQIIRLTGNGPEGVAMAVGAFTNGSILTGMIISTNNIAGPMTPWELDAQHYALPADAPAWIPTNTLSSGANAIYFAGWHLADSMTYAGFLEIAGLPPLKIWRAKYMTERLWSHPGNVHMDPAFPFPRSAIFDASLARRASDNELFVAEMSTSDDAATCIARLRDSLSSHKPQSHAPWSRVSLGKVQWQRSRLGVNIAAVDRWIVMETFDHAHEELILPELSRRAEH